jgi:hypothetical protein
MTFIADGQTRLYNLTVARLTAVRTTPTALAVRDGTSATGELHFGCGGNVYNATSSRAFRER